MTTTHPGRHLKNSSLRFPLLALVFMISTKRKNSNPQLTKKNSKACLTFAEKYLDYSRDCHKHKYKIAACTCSVYIKPEIGIYRLSSVWFYCSLTQNSTFSEQQCTTFCDKNEESSLGLLKFKVYRNSENITVI